MFKSFVVSSLCAALGLAFAPAAFSADKLGEVVEINEQLSPEAIENGLFPKTANSADCEAAAKAGFTCGQIVPRKTYSLPANISFGSGSAQLSDSARKLLAEFGPVFKRNEGSGNKVVFVGHTDITGSAALNKRLSQQRAESVRQYFIKNFSVAPSFLGAVGVGSEQLKDKGNPASPANRRVEISTKPAQ